jgi:16S rRNA (guanine966-N2)-methyltransferase
MRVIAGTYGGRTLAVPAGRATRPTSDRVREALFSILGERVRDRSVLDLFAGSGALSIEALSRGAADATLVDNGPTAGRAIERNLADLQIEGAELVRRDALGFLRTARDRGRQYDLVFLDPPYRQASRLSRELSEALPAVLAPGALVVSESDRREPLDLPPLTLDDERRYGDTLIRIHVP